VSATLSPVRKQVEEKILRDGTAPRRPRDPREFENRYLREDARQVASGAEIIGQSPKLRRLLEQANLVAATDATVLILGESGSGKEGVARRVHDRSRRRERPFIKVNCASIPRELFESEFFGHAKGAFTGALQERAGRFLAADGGTLFLDEVGEIPFDLQGKLLRVLQEGQFERVGEERTRTVDVRVVAATNRDLPSEVTEGRFRQDLYYRLSVFPLEVPPLREHCEDIPLLAAHFVAVAARRVGVSPPPLDPDEVQLLRHYAWPGNVRELQNVIERAVILARGGPIRVEALLDHRPVSRNSSSKVADQPSEEVVSAAEWRQRERSNIVTALRRAQGRIYGSGGAAALLGMKPTTLYSRIKTLRVVPSEYR
jgi:transcriptional regulator with GAF, ATPase, and Fis domain